MSSSLTQTRLRFDHFEMSIEEGDLCRVQVTLSFADRTITTDATDVNDGIGPLRAAAKAALNAVDRFVDGRIRCSLNDLDHVEALGKSLIAVLVDVVFERRDVQVFGSCQITGSTMDAAIKSALNATNRFVELSMRAINLENQSDR
jgi:hypothetical protein